jgi:hypothetical protein
MSTTTPARARTRAQLDSWLNGQKKGTRTAEQAAALDETFPSWRETRNGVWHSQLEAVERFLVAHGHFPRRSKGVDSHENSLSIWLATQRFSVQKLSAERRKLMDERLPGWNKTRDDRWEDRLADLQSYVAVNGRMPPGNSKDPAARRHRKWIENQSILPKDSHRRIRLKEAFPQWAPDNEEAWDEMLAALVAFVARNGRMPTQDEKDPDDHRTGLWLSTQRKQSLSDRRRERMNEFVPGWDWNDENRWSSALEYTIGYFAKHNKLPSERSGDPEVAFHGRWLGKQRRNAGKVGESRSTRLDSRLPAWRETTEHRWLIKVAYVKAFEASHGCFPSSGSKDAEEAAAATWLSRQRMGDGMTPERDAVLEAEIPRWREAGRKASKRPGKKDPLSRTHEGT